MVPLYILFVASYAIACAFTIVSVVAISGSSFGGF